jgi:CRISPR-associated protein Cas2
VSSRNCGYGELSPAVADSGFAPCTAPQLIMAEKHWHLITYDVRDPKRLRSVAKKLESYGTRIQFSVFRCRLDPEALEKLHWELHQLLTNEDDLLVIPLCSECAGKIPEHSTGDQTSWSGPLPTFRIV